jgi:two-component system, NarL family, sensor histidine kinase UhpB
MTLDNSKTRKVGRPTSALPGELRIVVLFLVFSALWILLSDRAVQFLAGDLARSTRLQTSKGLLFVLATAALLYALLRSAFRKRDGAIVQANSACERFEMVARASNDAIWDWDLLTDEIWWSEGLSHLFGYSREELEPTVESWIKRLHPEDRDRAVAGLQSAIDTGQTLWYDEYRFRRKDGSYAFVFDRGYVIHDKNKKPVRMVGGMMDVTARKDAEERADLYQRQMRALSARVESLREEERTRISREIHDDLGQMLTGLKMDLRWVEKQFGALEGPPPKLNPIVDRLVGATELADQAIERVQNISADLRPGVLDNLGLSTAISHEARRFQERTGIQCQVQLPREPLDLKSEVETALFRILQEGLTNVVRHSEATQVDISVAQENGNIVLHLRDNGKGISPEALANPRSLGLVGMKERASLLGGRIEFSRRAEGGTEMTLRVPEAANDTKFWELV